ncbi:MAG TPA: Gfo/Idh/MocA family oxidoreductase [Membranihabitans sp.]|nr:Gfo/Idh/MocA family oxidoreductase [Membranihabitans sp.]
MTNSNTNGTFNFAIIGTGSIAGLHIKAITDIPHARVVALCSSSPERAVQAEEKFGIKTYFDLDTMFDAQSIDAVIICTASGSHLEPCKASAQRGIHVLSEKPLEVTLERAREMIDVCRENQVKLACVFQSRFKPDFQRLYDAVQNNQLGKLILGNAFIIWYRPEEYYSSSPWRGTLEGDGGAALINQGIHTIDLLQNVMGPVKSVTAKVKTVVHDIEGEDLGVAMLEFQNGAMGVIQGSTAAYPGHPERLEVYGENGSVIMEAGKIISWNIKDEESKNENAHSSGKDSGASDPMAIDYAHHKYQIEDFIEAIRENREPVVTGEEGLKALALIRAIYESSSSGKSIDL